MPGAAHVTDPLVDELIGLYDRGILRLDAIVSAGLRRGLDPTRVGTPDQVRGDATHGYRARQLTQAKAIIEELIAQTEQHGPRPVAIAYRAGAIAVDRRVGPGAKAVGTFGLANHRAVEALAANMTGAMTAALERVGTNIETVFARADALEGGLPVRGIGGFPFIGRRVDDPWRAAGLEQVGQGLVAGDTRRQVTKALADRLIREGTADALTGFVARNGARIPLNVYAKTVARTTTREAVSRGTVDRLTESGQDLVSITSHPHKADACTPFDGKTFSLDGTTPGFPRLTQLPPFHPNCLHVLAPAGLSDLEAWERELGLAIAEPVQPPAPAVEPPAPRARAPRAPAAPPAPPAPSSRPDWAIATPDLPAVLDAGGRVLAVVERETAATLSRLKAVEARLLSELDDAQAEIDRIIARSAASSAGHPDYDEAFDRLGPARARRTQVELELDATWAQRDSAHRDALLAALRAERGDSYGTGTITNVVKGDDHAIELLNQAARFLPREWVDASNSAGVIKRASMSAGRGAHLKGGAGDTTYIEVREDIYNALHELVHRMQHVIPGLKGLEEDLYASRVTLASGKIAKLNRLSDEAGRSREFRVGDSFVIPAGFRGIWETLASCRKHYVICRIAPAAQ